MNHPNTHSAGSPEPLHSYILLRSDLPLPAQLAQCAHAAQESAFLLGADPGVPVHVVILSCEDEPALLAAAERLAGKGFDPGLFFEPDWPRGHTALYLPPQHRSAKLRAAMGAYSLWSTPTDRSPPAHVEPTGNPLNPRIVVELGDETMVRMSHLLNKVGLDLSDSLYFLRSQLEAAGQPTDELEPLEKLSDLIDPGAGPAGWARACDREESGYAQFRTHLAEGHAGDCTALPASCLRCWAESALGLDTAPASKSEGFRLLSIQATAFREGQAALDVDA